MHLGSAAQPTAYPGWPAQFSSEFSQLSSQLREPELWVSAAAAAVSVAAVALLAVSVLTAMAVFAAVVLEVVASAAAVVAAASVVVAVASAAAVVVAAESAAVAVAADSGVPDSPGCRSFLPRGPRSWLRDSSPGRAPESGRATEFGRAQKLRSRPSLRSRLRIPEPMSLQQGSSLVDLAPECRRAEVALASSVGPGQWTRSAGPPEEPCCNDVYRQKEESEYKQKYVA